MFASRPTTYETLMRMIRSSITRHIVIVVVIDNNAVIVVEAKMIRSCHSHLDVFRCTRRL